MKKLKAIVVGAGSRGTTYSTVMSKHAEKFQIVAVAEPKKDRRDYIKDLYNLENNMCFESYEPLFELGKIADFAVIATMDKDHLKPALKAIELGYDLLLEKPIAPTAEECIEINNAANKKGVKVLICTVLRYTDIFKTLKNFIVSGKIGKVMSINHEECVGNVHQSHSFVRGNWGNSKRSSDMLLQKSCHDLDILQWLINKKCKSVQSFGALSYFKAENAPEGAPEYCIQGCPNGEVCPYNAAKLYFDPKWTWLREPAANKPNPTDEDLLEVVTKTQYGKCVFKCDNDVVDHQTVNMLFEDDVTVTFTMNAFNKGGRFIHIMGTLGELRAALDEDTPITYFDFVKHKTETIPLVGKDGIAGGHGGGDTGIMLDLYDYFTDNYSGVSIPTIEESLYNHMLVFATEQARKTNTIVDVQKFIETF